MDFMEKLEEKRQIRKKLRYERLKKTAMKALSLLLVLALSLSLGLPEAIAGGFPETEFTTFEVVPDDDGNLMIVTDEDDKEIDDPGPGNPTPPPDDDPDKNQNNPIDDPYKDPSQNEGNIVEYNIVSMAKPFADSSGIRLTAQMQREKQEMARLGVFEGVKKLTPDKDYINHELIFATDNLHHAQTVAAAYNAILTSFSNGVAVIKTASDTIDAVGLAQNTTNDFPAVYPNYIYTLNSTVYSRQEIYAALGEEFDLDIESNNEDEFPENQYNENEAGTSITFDTLEDDELVNYINPEDIETAFERNKPTQKDIDALNAFQSKNLISADEMRQGTGAGAFSTGADPFIGRQWYLNNVGVTGTNGAWNISTGKDIRVAVIDSGICTTHPDLRGNTTAALNTAGHAINGAVDNHGHGTHVSGIIAAIRNNGIGIAGVAPEAKIISIKALDLVWAAGWGSYLAASGSSADITRAVNLAVSRGAQIINMSLGGWGSFPSQDIVYRDSIINASNRGIVVVAAAGNETEDLFDDITSYPAAFPTVITVSATTEQNTLAEYSNFSTAPATDPRSITIAAPGGDGVRGTAGEMLSTYKNNSYKRISGTSMAAPVVSGVVALVLASNRIQSDNANRVDAVTSLLTSTAQKDGALGTTPRDFGAGLVRADRAVGADITGTPNLILVPNLGGYIPPGPPAQATALVGEGRTITLLPVFSPGRPGNTTLTNWISSATGVATVTNRGVVRGVSPGVTTISAEHAGTGAKASIQIQVFPSTGAISLNQTSVERDVGGTFQLSVANVTPSGPTGAMGGVSSGTSQRTQFTFTSSNDRIATVDEFGLVTARGSGTARITVTARDGSGTRAVCSVRVSQPVLIVGITNRIGLPAADGFAFFTGINRPVACFWDGDRNNLITYPVGIGQSINLTPVFAQRPTDRTLVWTSYNTSRATVKNGRITGFGVGPVLIGVRGRDDPNGLRERFIYVNVQQTVSALGLAYAAPQNALYNLAFGRSLNYRVTVIPTNAANRKVTYGVTNNEFFKISSGGSLSAKQKWSGAGRQTTRVIFTVGNDTWLTTTPIALYNDSITNIVFADPRNEKTIKSLTMTERELGPNWPESSPVGIYGLATGPDIYRWFDVWSTDDRISDFAGGFVWAFSPGNVTISARSLDGSNRNTSMRVRVLPLPPNTNFGIGAQSTTSIRYGRTVGVSSLELADIRREMDIEPLMEA